MDVSMHDKPILKLTNIIFSFVGYYKFLSNFHTHEEITYNKMKANNVEHLYQASKATCKEDKEYVLTAETPNRAKVRGKLIECRKDWEDVKINVMRDLLKLKFEIPDLKQQLINTKGIVIIEGNYWKDTFWGVYEGEGKNMLGELLMELRRELTGEPVIEFNKEEVYGRIRFKRP
ncbi:MAG: NADAR family protein [Novosphingobium sp.]|nr:NADAR family protein [Novosphingobium sp.]